jgi:hypothetical protein
MTASQRAEQLGRALAEMQNPARFLPITTELIARKSERIFTKGMGADGNPLPPYSTKPISIGKKGTPRKSAAGKYEGGYGEFKAAIGRGGNTNLFLFGLLQSAYTTGIVPAVSGTLWQFGSEIRPSSSNPAGKLEGILNRYPTAFGTSDSEKKLVQDRIRSEIRRIFGAS